MSEFETALFEEKHMISIMMFLYVNGPSRKIDMYTSVSTNPHIPDKLNRLESKGLITQWQDPARRSTIIELTDKGREVADHMMEINKIIVG